MYLFNIVTRVSLLGWFFFFKQKTAYEIRISDWSSDVCSSDLDQDDDRLALHIDAGIVVPALFGGVDAIADENDVAVLDRDIRLHAIARGDEIGPIFQRHRRRAAAETQRADILRGDLDQRSEEHTSELQSLMRISYADFCL